jgi:membrane-associated phospholipid phosphatase
MKEWLHNIDYKLFFLVNDTWKNSFFDTIMPWMRNPATWIPLYILLLLLYIKDFRKNVLWVLLFAGITILLTDQISAHVIKLLVHRLRPCNRPELLGQIHVLVNCGSGYSFVSSHATNHFGLALFFIGLSGKKYKWFAPVFLLWAAIISYAQVYVGVHFPIDVICGGILGAAIGVTTAYFCNKVILRTTKQLKS